MEESSPRFREVQRFRQLWVWLLVLGIAGLNWVGAVQQLLFGIPFGQNPAPDSMMFFFWLLFGVGLPLFFWTCRLITEVRGDGVYVRYVPLHRRFQRIAFTDLHSYQVETYAPLRTYGGWGIRYGAQGKAYTVSGNQGLLLRLIDGRQVLIGSQQPAALNQAVAAALGGQGRTGA